MGTTPHRNAILMLISFMAVVGIVLSKPAYADSKPSFAARSNIDFSRMETGQYTVEVLLNGQGPFRFMIDSAATRTSIFEKTLTKLNLQQQWESELLVSGMTAARLRPTITLDSVSFGKSIFNDHSVVILEDWNGQGERLDGILGLEILKEFSLAFSHEDNRLRIRKKFKAHAAKYRGWNIVRLISNPYPVKDHGLKFTGAEIGKSIIPAMIDTGANFTTISWNSLEGTRLANEKKRLREEWLIQGAVGEFKPQMVVRLDEISIGGISLTKHELLLMDFDQLQVNGKGEYPLVIAGVDLMGGRDFVLDLQNNALYVQSNSRARKSDNSINIFDHWNPDK